MSKYMDRVLLKRRALLKKQIGILQKLLASKSIVHPPGCNCAIKSRVVKYHLMDCPYRMLKEIVPLLKREAKESTS